MMETERKSDQEIGEDFASTFSDFCNSMSREPKKFAVAKMLREHRTIQQNMMRFCMQFIEGMAANGHDGRNEASVELAKAIMEIESRKRALPYI
jgi:hypothetical protein